LLSNAVCDACLGDLKTGSDNDEILKLQQKISELETLLALSVDEKQQAVTQLQQMQKSVNNFVAIVNLSMIF